MAWNDTLNPFGLAGNPPPAQQTTMQLTNTTSSGAVPANQISGQVTQTLQVVNAANPNSTVYIDSRGIYAGNSVFADAPARIGINGDAVFTSASIQTSSTGQRVFIGEFAYASGEVEGIQIWNLAGEFIGLIYGSFTGLTISDANTPGGNSSLGFNNAANTGGMTGYNGLDFSSQLGPITFSFGAGTPTPVVTMSETLLGFFGNPGSTQPTVTGSLGSDLEGVVLSLIFALEDLGLIIDGTTP